MCIRDRSLREQGLAAAGGANHEDIALLELHIFAATVKNTLIAVSYTHLYLAICLTSSLRRSSVS